VEGPTLADKLQLGPIPWAEAVALIRQVLSALAYAHQEKIVHRDITPENIVISPGGVLKVANFALAKGATSPKLTQVGLMVGNLKYISPEQIKGTGELDARSDLYAVGMVLYEMLCGRPAFDCQSLFELMAAQVVQTPVPPDQVNPDVPRELAAVVLKALSKDPADRYQTSPEFDEALVKVSGAPRSNPAPAGLTLSAPQALSIHTNGGGLTDATTRLATPGLSVSRPKELLLHPTPVAAAAPTTPAPALVREPNLVQEPKLVQEPNVRVGRVNCPSPALPADSASLPGIPTVALPAPALKPSVTPQTMPAQVPSMAPVPAFLVAGSNAPISKQQLIIGAAAGASFGVLVVALWLFAK
jgi:serine/threonine protein kinase